MATLNQWGDDPRMEEGIGDELYDKIEEKAKEGAEDAAKQGARLAGQAVDKLTDKIGPINKAKNFVRDKISLIKQTKDKIKKKATDLAKKGLKAVGKAALHAAKSTIAFLVANPLLLIIVILGVILLLSIMQDVQLSGSADQDNDVLLDSPIYVDVDGMVDDEVVVLLMDDCVTSEFSDMDDTVNAEKEGRAKQLWSIFHKKGFNNASIAGILGCFDCESGLDSAAVEGIMNEYGALGPKKAAALLDLSEYTLHDLFPRYNRDGVNYSPSGYKVVVGNDEYYYCGIGLAQFTASATYDIIRVAKTANYDWYAWDFQVAYIASDSFYRSGFFANWLGSQVEPDDDSEEAWIQAARDSADYFALGYEGAGQSHLPARENAAESWIKIIKDWDDADVDTEFVDSITSLAGDLGAIIDLVEIEKLNFRCTNNHLFDNSSLAAAAVSYAWPRQEQSFNNGTNLYQVVHDGLWGPQAVYKSCDRTVAGAVLWSGTDDSYPAIGCSNQLAYLQNSAKWEFVGMSTEVTYDELQPGDVFIIPQHTALYVGKELVQKAYADEADPDSDSVSGSWLERSPGCDRFSTGGMILRNGGLDWDGRGAYYIFRCVDPDNSDTYSHLGSGVTD